MENLTCPQEPFDTRTQVCACLLCIQADGILKLRKRPELVITNPLCDQKPLVLIKNSQLLQGSYRRAVYVLLAHILACTPFHPLFPCTVVWSSNELWNEEVETRHRLLEVDVQGIAELLCSKGYAPFSTGWTRDYYLCGLCPVDQLAGLK